MTGVILRHMEQLSGGFEGVKPADWWLDTQGITYYSQPKKTRFHDRCLLTEVECHKISSVFSLCIYVKYTLMIFSITFLCVSYIESLQIYNYIFSVWAYFYSFHSMSCITERSLAPLGQVERTSHIKVKNKLQ